MKIKSKNKILTLFFGFCLICIGVAIGIAIRHYYYIPIAETFDIIDVATLITTIFIAVYVPSVLSREMQIKKEKKDLISHRIDEVQDFYRRINILVQQDMMTERDKINIKNLLDIILHRFETISILLSYVEVKKTVSFSEDINIIMSLADEYKRLLSPKELEHDDFKYSKNIQEQEERLYNEIDRLTSLVLFKLSDA